MEQQIVEVWRYLAQNNVKYVTIGGFAVNLYGYGRSTGDIDIYIDDTRENRRNLRNAIKKMGIGDFEIIETMQFVPGWTDFSLNYGFKLDVMTQVLGLELISFDELLDSAMIADIDGVQVFFIDYENLIKTKKASNRPKDQLDIIELEKINRNTEF